MSGNYLFLFGPTLNFFSHNYINKLRIIISEYNS